MQVSGAGIGRRRGTLRNLYDCQGKQKYLKHGINEYFIQHEEKVEKAYLALPENPS